MGVECLGEAGRQLAVPSRVHPPISPALPSYLPRSLLSTGVYRLELDYIQLHTRLLVVPSTLVYFPIPTYIPQSRYMN